MFCTECGTQIDEGKKFCRNCGARTGRQAPDPQFESDRTSAATPAWPRPTAAKTSPGIDKSVAAVAVVAFIVIAGSAGIYFGTDLLRPSSNRELPPADELPGRSAATDGAPPGRSAATAGSPGPSEEPPGRSAATVGASPPSSERPGRPAGTVGAPPPFATRPSAPAVASRRTADTGIYETLRGTSVFEEPSASSRIVANIPGGVRVTVVSSTGNWLEVRSKSGKPPGFIRRGDAMFVERPG